MTEKEAVISRIRAFNRFYMPKLKLLDNHYLNSEYTPTEARVLYEIHENDGCSAASIAKTMNIDKSYLSRIIRAYEKKGYLVRIVSSEDTRAYKIHLTESGKEFTEDFIQKSNEQVENIIGSLNEDDYAKLIEALDTVTMILEK